MAPVNVHELDWDEYDHGETSFRRQRLAAAAGGDELGCSMYELPPGHTSWPYHYHTANEEAMYVLAGEGTLRLDGETYDIHAGSFASFPAEAAGAHKVINDGDEPLRYLLVSTMVAPDVAVYPDSDKFGIFVGAAPGEYDGREFSGYFSFDDEVDYWAGES